MMRWFPQNISTYGPDIDHLIHMIFWIVGVWFVATQALILWAVVFHRRGTGRKAAYVRGETWSQLAWVMVPVIVVFGLDLFIDEETAPVWAHIKEQRPAQGVHVKATARQFNWDFTYPGPDGEFGTADDLELGNELHVPAGQNVLVDLQSKDVLHSFFLPVVRLKQDVVPGRTIKAWFNATVPGHYELPCAELCGFGHYTMRGFLDVHSPEDYAKWVAEKWPPKAAE